MNLDFAGIHRDLLTGSSTPSGWAFKPANPNRPGSDLYVASHQIFSNHGLCVSLLIRNGLSPERTPISATPLVSLAFSRKVDGAYLLARDTSKIIIPIYLAEAIQLFACLAGEMPTVLFDVVRPGVPQKHLRCGPAADQAYRFLLSAYQMDSDSQQSRIDVAITQVDVFHIQAYLLALGRLVYPWMETTVIADLYRSSSVARQPQERRGEDPQSEPQMQAIQEQAVDRVGQQPRAIDPDRISKAVFAVGINKWPAKRRDVIRHIQETATFPAMDRLIQAGNAGDFSEWDRIAAEFDLCAD
jgi:hypothetical protein